MSVENAYAVVGVTTGGVSVTSDEPSVDEVRTAADTAGHELAGADD
ncbi:hypothetical protein [Micromonospora sp. NPDC050200]